jgi:hypothetical protein
MNILIAICCVLGIIGWALWTFHTFKSLQIRSCPKCGSNDLIIDMEHTSNLFKCICKSCGEKI